MTPDDFADANHEKRQQIIESLRELTPGNLDFCQKMAARLRGFADSLAPKATKPASLSLRPISADWLSQPLPPAPALLSNGGKPWFLQGKVGLLVAPGGTGKTWFMVQAAVAIATGGKLFDKMPAERGRVLLALGEEDEDEIRRRVYAASRWIPSEAQRLLTENLFVLGLSGRSVAFLEREAAQNPTPTVWFNDFKSSLAAAGEWRCILLDPWSRWGGPDVETDPHWATRGVELLEELTKLPGNPSVLLAHHASKAGGAAAEATSSRGTSALTDAVRWAASLTVPTANNEDRAKRLTLTVTKRNHTAPDEPVELIRGTNGVLKIFTGPLPAKTGNERRTAEPDDEDRCHDDE